jgi:hypothetical protein
MFYVPSFKIYGSVAGFYDYGPPGCAVKQNLTALWRKHFILEENMLEARGRRPRGQHACRAPCYAACYGQHAMHSLALRANLPDRNGCRAMRSAAACMLHACGGGLRACTEDTPVCRRPSVQPDSMQPQSYVRILREPKPREATNRAESPKPRGSKRGSERGKGLSGQGARGARQRERQDLHMHSRHTHEEY